MSGNRFALLIASSQYEDTNIGKLIATANDMEALAKVLRDPKIGGFDVKISLNDPHYIVRQLIDDFFQDRKKDDLLLLYFSGHGFKENELYFAAFDTKLKLLRATGISASYINDLMQNSNSRSQVLILDCCFSGAFIRGMVSKGDKRINIKEHFNGYGKVVLTSSDSSQYSYEGETISGEGVRSIFTNAIVRGLETGEADIDGDDFISVNDLYQYVDNCVNSEHQHPTISTLSMKKEIYIARSPDREYERITKKLHEEFGNKLPSDVLAECQTILNKYYNNQSLLEESDKTIFGYLEPLLKDNLSPEKRDDFLQNCIKTVRKKLLWRKPSTYIIPSDLATKKVSEGFKCGSMIQAFFWDCPALEYCEHQWWVEVEKRIPALQQAGFTAIWLPPVSKAASWKSMGYDPYDYYDLGEFDQKGGIPTWFGTKAELLSLIQTAHAHGMQVYADMVFNHNSGGDAQEENPIDHKMRWTKFNPESKQFSRDLKCFHPSRYEQWDGATFGDMPHLCHRNPYVYDQLLEYARWLLEIIGFDGFRYDMIRGYGGYMIRTIQELRAIHDGQAFKPFGVGECWDNCRTIEDWLNEVNAYCDNPVSAFDFPLRYLLRDLCDNSGFSLRNLEQKQGTLLYDRPTQTVTFVENHDVARNDPVILDKLLAYAFILTHEGYPCVFWQDYFNCNLAQEGNSNGIAALVQIHAKHASGDTSLLYVDDDLYVMQRGGYGSSRGFVLVLNKGSTWNGKWVQTRWSNTRFSSEAWYGSNYTGVPEDKWTNDSGWTELWAPPRGYVVYIPQ